MTITIKLFKKNPSYKWTNPLDDWMLLVKEITPCFAGAFWFYVSYHLYPVYRHWRNTNLSNV